MSETAKKRTPAVQTLPMLVLRGLVLFPKIIIHFDVSREKSMEALAAAVKEDKQIFITAQSDYSEDITQDNICKVGIVASVRQMLRTHSGTRVMVEGLYRAKLVKTVSEEPYLTAQVKRYPDRTPKVSDEEMEALLRAVKDEFQACSMNMPRMPEEYINNVLNNKDPRTVFDNIAVSMPLSVEEKQMLLEANGLVEKLSLLLSMLTRESQVMSLERELHERVHSQLDENQREYYLREQLKAIQEELEEGDMGTDAFEYMEKIAQLNLPEASESKLMREAQRLSSTAPSSQEAYVIRNYLDTVLDLPWNVSSKEKNDIKKVKAVLDKDHYGMDKVKDRILETIAVRQLEPEIKGQIICLYGPPGVGKTSVAKSIARALGRKYVRVSLGGIRDEADIRGHRKTYVGAMAGRIINAISEAGTNNPLLLLDEVDKISDSYKGDPSSALLEVLDSEQNTAFRDHYIEVPFDLSNVMFVTTANNISEIDPPLLDRMEVIELNSYTAEEKFHIAKEHLVPKQLKKHGMKRTMLRINDAALRLVIDGYTREAGVRQLERCIASLCRKAAKEIIENDLQKVSITASNLESYLGHRKYLESSLSNVDEVGVVNGLAWTAAGGVIMPLEVLVMEGKGNVTATGSLGDVMKESSGLAVSYVRSIADKYGIDKNFHKEKDIHIHAPEGATPKDGPSAGVTMTTALVSALSGIPVRHDVAMTGEITLHGKVLPIGGLREKTMAAYKEGMKTVVIPAANKGDLDDVDPVVKDGLEFVLADRITEVLDAALTQKPKSGGREHIYNGDDVRVNPAKNDDKSRVPVHS